jgi:hypothetical protein
MKRLLPGLAGLLLAAACSDAPEIPPIEVGGPEGIRLMNGQARTPLEAYDMAYSVLGRHHRDVHRNLEPRGRNLVGAETAMRSIVRSLHTMRALAAPAERPKFDPYVTRYQGFLRDLERNTWGGSFLASLEVSEREVKSKFHPREVDILAEFPASSDPAAAGKPSAAPPAGPEAAVPADKVEAPPQKPSAAPPAPPAAKPADAPAAPAPPGVSPRLSYKAWDRSHDELVEAYKARKDCRAKYGDVTEALRLLKSQQSGERAAKLQIYIDYYAAIHEKTQAFTALPEKTTEKDIVDELDVAARVIRKEFNPDK